jgi:hypothetical protein
MIVSLRLGKPSPQGRQMLTPGRDPNSVYKLCRRVTSVRIMGQTVDFGIAMTSAASVLNVEGSHVLAVSACGNSGRSRCRHAVDVREVISFHLPPNDPFNY